MKKTLYVAVALVAMSLYSCDSTGKQSDNNAASGTATEQVENKANTGEAVATGTEAPEGLTGDMEKDADILVKASLDMSVNMVEGKDKAEEQAKVQKLMDEAKDYYGKQGKSEEFAKIVGEKMSKGLTEIAAKMKKK